MERADEQCRLTAESTDLILLNSLAWLMATRHNAFERDGKAAVVLAERVATATNRKQPYVLDTLAASYAEAGDFIKRYFERFPAVQNWLSHTKLLAAEQGYVETVLGRRRYWGPRAVTVRVGEALDLRQYLEQYRSDPAQASQAAISEVERRVQALLAQTASLMTPLSAPHEIR